MPADHGPAVWDALHAAGQPHGITAYGTETMHVLRAEKGYVIVGQDTDGTATPDDAGVGWAVAQSKRDFVGKRSLARASMSDPAPQAACRAADPRRKTVLEEGAQLVEDPRQPVPKTLLGHVTSSYFSASLGHPIALAMLSRRPGAHRQTLHVPMPGGAIAVRVTSPVFYDPQGARLDG